MALRKPTDARINESESSFMNLDKIFPFFPLKFLLKSKYNAIGKVPSVNMPKLFLHGTEDEIIPFIMGRKLFEAAGEPKEFYAIKGAGHNDTYHVGGKEYFDTIDRFIHKALQRKKEAALGPTN